MQIFSLGGCNTGSVSPEMCGIVSAACIVGRFDDSLAGVSPRTGATSACVAAGDFDRARHWPMAIEALKIAPTGRMPANL